MKKIRTYIATCLSLFLLASCFESSGALDGTRVNGVPSEVESNKPANPRFYVPKDQEFFGTYLPDLYIEQIRISKNHSKTIHSSDANFYSLFSVRPDAIYSDLRWHDGFAIRYLDGVRFRFFLKDGIHKIEDENGYYYTRISENYRDSYQEIDRFVLGIVFSQLLARGEAHVTDHGIEINGRSFRIMLDDMFFPKTLNALLFEEGSENYFGVVILGDVVTFYQLLSNQDDIERLVGPEIQL